MTTKRRIQLNKWLAAFSAVAALAAIQTHAQTWQVLLPSNDTDAGGPSSSGVAVFIDPFANPDNPAPGVFVGTKNYGSGAHTILKLSSTADDPPFTYVTVDKLDNALTRVSRIIKADDGLYAVGQGPQDPNAKNTVDVWRVRMSPDQGNTWADRDKFSLTKGSFSVATSATTDAGGNIYVAGMASTGSTPHWVVRRKPSGPSGVWATVFDQKAQDVNLVPGICFFGGNANNSIPAVVTVGILNNKWTVFRRQNPGSAGSWVAVDTWPKEPKTAEATAYDAACDSSGNIYVVGCRGRNAVNPSAWIVRRSSTGGDSWENLLDVGAGVGFWAYRIGFDPAGNAWVAGVVNPTGNQPLWTVLRNSPGQAWQDSADGSDSWSLRTRPFGDTTYSKGAGVAVDHFGNVFLTGGVVDWNDDGNLFPGERAGMIRIPAVP